MKKWSVFLLLAINIGCATTQQTSNQIVLDYDTYKNNLNTKKIDSFILSGKISLFIKDKGLSGTVRWQSQKGEDNIEIYGPFNNTLAKISLNESLREITFIPASDSEAMGAQNIIKEIFDNTETIFILKSFLISPPSHDRQNHDVLVNYHGWLIKYSGVLEINPKMAKTIEYIKGNISLKIFISSLTS